MREYDLALEKIMREGWDQTERTNKGCKTLFGLTTRYDISQQVPVLTFRKIAWKSFVKEVLWYISGSDNIHDLEKMGCGVWTPWVNDEFTRRTGFAQGSLGYGYGPNLIDFGGDLNAPRRQGVNQLDYVIETLKTNPGSRQAMFVMWRPDKLDEVLLPACHFAYHFMISPDQNGEMKDLTCQIFQRSCDYAIGVGAGNLFIGTIFTYLIAQQLGLKPKELIHSGSHCHVYHNAIDSTRDYLGRALYDKAPPSPRLVINPKPSIYDYTIDDFELLDYNPLPKITFPIAV